MTRLDPQRIVAPEQSRLIAIHAARLVRGHGLDHLDDDDVQQELWLVLVRVAAQYYAPRGRFAALAEVTARNRCRQIARHERAGRRARHQEAPLGDALDIGGPGECRRVELRLDLSRALGRLRELDRRLAVLLMTHTVTEAAHALEIPRSTACDARRRIRAACVEHSLDAYLGDHEEAA